MGFDLAKHGLNSKTWIRAIGLSFFRDQNVREKEKRKERRRGRGREEEENRGRMREVPARLKRYGTMTMSMDSSKIWYGFWFCMVNGLPQT